MGRKKPLLLLIIAGLIFMAGCTDKNSETDFNPNVKSSRSLIFTEDIFMEVLNTYFKSVNDQEVLAGENGWIDNATVTYDEDENEMLFNYGAVNRDCPDGKFRRGYFMARFDGPVNQLGTTATITFLDLYVNDDMVTGTISSEFQGNDTGKWLYTFNVQDGMVEQYDTIDTVRMKYACNYQVSWDQGSETPDDPSDDLLSLTGSMQGYSIQGTEFSSLVTVPLQNYIDCFYITSGIHELTVPSGAVNTGTVDYVEEDDCNNIVKFYFDENFFFDILEP